jgi:hypothetical protein
LCALSFLALLLLIVVIDQVAVVVPNREVLHNWLNGSAAPEAKVLARSLPCVCVRVCVCVCVCVCVSCVCRVCVVCVCVCRVRKV